MGFPEQRSAPNALCQLEFVTIAAARLSHSVESEHDARNAKRNNIWRPPLASNRGRQKENIQLIVHAQRALLETTIWNTTTITLHSAQAVDPRLPSNRSPAND